MATKQLTLAYPIVEQLTISRGVFDVDDLSELQLDPEQRQNLPMLAAKLGVAMCAEPRERTVDDGPLEVRFADIKNTWSQHLNSGLYIAPEDGRFKDAEQLIVIGRHDPDLELPGVVSSTQGVVFPAIEFNQVARNARDLVKHTRANTRKANEENAKYEGEDLDAAVNRSAAHALRGKLESMEELDDKLIKQRELMIRMYRDSNFIWRTAYLAKNLNRDRKQADELIHQTAATAAINLDMSSREVSAMHRAFAAELYRRGSSTDLARKWQRTIIWVGRNLNAKRGKIEQSTKDCKVEFSKFSQYLPADE